MNLTNRMIMKTYLKPNVKVVRLVHARALMSGSNGFDGNSIQFNNDNMTEGDGGDAAARRSSFCSSFWDNEE